MSLARPSEAFLPDDASLRAFCDLLGARTGLQVRSKDLSHTADILARRCRTLKTSVPEYLKHLLSQRDDQGEWTLLLPLLTNGESYFERDKGQFELLRTKILPELIERRRATGENVLRLWSAGCSTGEEAYSLAMTVDSVLPSGWSAAIMGTDINLKSLQKARVATYGAWSFRGVAPATLGTYFRPTEGGQQIVPSLRRQVTFEFCNLSAPNWPDPKRGIHDLDLILCRNVLIYFQRPVVADVLSRFVRTLRPGGILMTGHAELHDQNLSALRTRLFAESAVYQKTEETNGVPIATSSPLPVEVSRPLKTKIALTPSSRLSPLRPSTFVKSVSSSQPVSSEPAPKQKTVQNWGEKARLHANRAEYEKALDCCQRAIQADATCADAYLVWAQICEEQGQGNEAKNLLRKVIYLTPSHVEAYAELAAIYEREGENVRARQMRVTGLEILLALPSSVLTPQRNALLHHLQDELGDGHVSSTATTQGVRK